MLELTLVAIVSLVAMSLLVFLFLKLNQTQTSLIQSLTLTNQSLLNQVRSKDIGTLQGLQMATGTLTPEPDYQTVEMREMQAYLQSLSHEHELGDTVYDDMDAELAQMKDEL
jgi:hypothetical protein